MPMGWIFVAWPLTGATWLLFGVERLANDWRILRHGPRPGDEPPSRESPPAGSVV
jgi:TRAP-type C4-dicarboxylate transport system permease small subunit